MMNKYQKVNNDIKAVTSEGAGILGNLHQARGRFHTLASDQGAADGGFSPGELSGLNDRLGEWTHSIGELSQNLEAQKKLTKHIGVSFGVEESARQARTADAQKVFSAIVEALKADIRYTFQELQDFADLPVGLGEQCHTRLGYPCGTSGDGLEEDQHAVAPFRALAVLYQKAVLDHDVGVPREFSEKSVAEAWETIVGHELKEEVVPDRRVAAVPRLGDAGPFSPQIPQRAEGPTSTKTRGRGPLDESGFPGMAPIRHGPLVTRMTEIGREVKDLDRRIRQLKMGEQMFVLRKDQEILEDPAMALRTAAACAPGVWIGPGTSGVGGAGGGVGAPSPSMRIARRGSVQGADTHAQGSMQMHMPPGASTMGGGDPTRTLHPGAMDGGGLGGRTAGALGGGPGPPVVAAVGGVSQLPLRSSQQTQPGGAGRPPGVSGRVPGLMVSSAAAADGAAGPSHAVSGVGGGGRSGTGKFHWGGVDDGSDRDYRDGDEEGGQEDEDSNVLIVKPADLRSELFKMWKRAQTLESQLQTAKAAKHTPQSESLQALQARMGQMRDQQAKVLREKSEVESKMQQLQHERNELHAKVRELSERLAKATGAQAPKIETLEEALTRTQGALEVMKADADLLAGMFRFQVEKEKEKDKQRLQVEEALKEQKKLVNVHDQKAALLKEELDRKTQVICRLMAARQTLLERIAETDASLEIAVKDRESALEDAEEKKEVARQKEREAAAHQADLRRAFLRIDELEQQKRFLLHHFKEKTGTSCVAILETFSKEGDAKQLDVLDDLQPTLAISTKTELKAEAKKMSSDAHGTPEGECLVCFDDLSEENYVEYRTTPESAWFPGKFCEACLGQLMDTQFDKFCNDLSKTTCAREQRVLLERGPPINVFDKNAFPEAGDAEVHSLWFASDKEIHSAKLKGSLEGEARMKYWEDQKKFQIKDEKDEDEEGGGKK
uniref:Uncharacterized protein n=1 Tax=Chromera velia CCMP2878 TaxID=1169474 RepID=A0A0G4FTQ5_9ALVE|eukprot:Cvel_3738.t1-p1 / transcript=Cvel_3738.t1 / gene=Cvel_3738 / organism=Chromera_velia_CCMP2878 / gene_product=Huntingtin-interacting protein 1-related protein, putative / transcript_product=Huntingtin-interacting protein 1-related protein, putative / location=Cvel_scaffold156:10014-19539(-) / protein_length=950 / sequence_SO=supercontig / SO=protein_coding / is_pseudo=false